EQELSILSGHFTRIRAGRGGARLVLLTGTAGGGKTRLAAEAATRARLGGWTVVEVDAGGGGRPEPFGAWASALRALLLATPELAAELPGPVLTAVARLNPEARHLAGRGGHGPSRADLFA